MHPVGGGALRLAPRLAQGVSPAEDAIVIADWVGNAFCRLKELAPKGGASLPDLAQTVKVPDLPSLVVVLDGPSLAQQVRREGMNHCPLCSWNREGVGVVGNSWVGIGKGFAVQVVRRNVACLSVALKAHVSNCGFHICILEESGEISWGGSLDNARHGWPLAVFGPRHWYHASTTNLELEMAADLMDKISNGCESQGMHGRAS